MKSRNLAGDLMETLDSMFETGCERMMMDFYPSNNKVHYDLCFKLSDILHDNLFWECYTRVKKDMCETK